MKTSINIQPVKSSSEAHNLREKPLSYVREDLSHNNESFKIDTISNRLKQINKLYEATTRQKMQKKATPIREGVVVIGEKTTMQQLKSFTDKCESKWGLRALQIHIHKDEGHNKADEWKSNLHAHIVWDWTDKETAKSLKLNKIDMSEMQTILAESLKMERGASSDLKHLTAIQYKNDKEKERLKELIQQAEQIKGEIKSLELSKKVKKTASNALKNAFGGLELTKAEKELKMAKNDIEKLKIEYKELAGANGKLKNNIDLLKMQHELELSKQNREHGHFRKLSEEYRIKASKVNEIRQQAVKLFSKFDQDTQRQVAHAYPTLFPESLMNKGKDKGMSR